MIAPAALLAVGTALVLQEQSEPRANDIGGDRGTDRQDPASSHPSGSRQSRRDLRAPSRARPRRLTDGYSVARGLRRSYNRRMRRSILLAVVAIVSLGAQDRGDRSDLGVVGRIKTEAFDNSQVMDTLGSLTDVYGPRLTASPEYRQAADWVVKRLEGYGIENVHLEKFGPIARRWSLKQSSLEMLEPRYASLDAAALAWSDSTKGMVTGEPVLTPFGNGRQQQDPKKFEADLNQYMAAWKGKLKGKIVLLTALRDVRPATQPLFSRYTDKELSDIGVAPTPVAKLSDLKDLKFPEDPDEERRFLQSLPAWVREHFAEQRRATTV